MSSTFKTILYETADGVAKINLNRPPLNIINAEMLPELNQALEKANSDDSVALVEITAVGDRAFSAGVEVKDHLPEKVGSTIPMFNKAIAAVFNLNKPTVAVVKGVALGGGCELAIACDIIIAGEKAQFGQPEIAVGAIPPMAIVLMPKLIGRKKAFELIMTGDVITAAEAKQIGLVNTVVPEDKLEEATKRLVDKLKEKSPVVLKLTRIALRECVNLDFEKALEKVTDLYLNRLMKTEDAVEGLKAFIEKRKPQWKGK
jgi:cyclohexa-1,5-dienecarbonyl-CoA hydratase